MTRGRKKVVFQGLTRRISVGVVEGARTPGCERERVGPFVPLTTGDGPGRPPVPVRVPLLGPALVHQESLTPKPIENKVSNLYFSGTFGKLFPRVEEDRVGGKTKHRTGDRGCRSWGSCLTGQGRWRRRVVGRDDGGRRGGTLGPDEHGGFRGTLERRRGQALVSCLHEPSQIDSGTSGDPPSALPGGGHGTGRGRP